MKNNCLIKFFIYLFFSYRYKYKLNNLSTYNKKNLAFIIRMKKEKSSKF